MKDKVTIVVVLYQAIYIYIYIYIYNVEYLEKLIIQIF